jgi:phosphoribosylformimino-5-aminoimidazole carboxamide ribotide isomerase
LILYPAIDIRGGRAVRLTRGDYARETVYEADPLDAARRWARDGARFLHVVDLDGALEGRPVNLEHVGRIVDEVGIPVQVGGGLRDLEAVGDALAAGAARVVLGTKALDDRGLVTELVQEHDERIVASVDVREGRVSVEGWTRPTAEDPAELVGDLGRRGIRRVVYTRVDVDGTMAGPALDDLRRVAGNTEAGIIYSGGIGSIQDLEALTGLGLPNLEGAIVGRALYEGRLTVSAGQAALQGEV